MEHKTRSVAQPVHDEELDAMSGGAISGQDEARKLLDEYLASLDILSRRADLSADAKAVLQTSLTATLARKINDAVSITPAS
ncbi:MAG: hypothetical protein ABWY05_15210 [Noviherbaspirillum sp.]